MNSKLLFGSPVESIVWVFASSFNVPDTGFMHIMKLPILSSTETGGTLQVQCTAPYQCKPMCQQSVEHPLGKDLVQHTNGTISVHFINRDQ